MSTIELASSEVSAVPAAAETAWPFVKRWVFAFTVIFFVLGNWWFPWAYIPGLDKVAEWIGKGWDVVVVPVAAHVFHVTASTAQTGSGDSTYSYVAFAIYIAVALAAGLACAVLDRTRAHYERVRQFFRLFLRYALAATMISYGAFKVIPSQFTPPTLDRLVEPIGAASPMGILWTFMGASLPYVVLTGMVEMIGGLLLTMRRTALLGALISAGAMANVVALNFCYDVPVKLNSTLYLLEALVIAAPDFRRMASVFVLQPRDERPLFRKKWAMRSVVAAGVLLTATITFFSLRQSDESRRTGGYLAPRSPLRGVWSVDELTDNGASRPPLTTDVNRWRRFIFDSPRTANIQFMSDARFRYLIELNEKAKTIKLTDWEHRNRVMSFAYARPGARTLVLDSTVDGHKMHAVCHLSELAAKPLLTTRGFHWINEFPFNR